MNTEQPNAIAINGENIIYKICVIRGQKVMLDKDLTAMYGLEPRGLNQSVKTNISRFPDDFMFQLTEQEVNSLRSQIVILKKDRVNTVNFCSMLSTE